MTSNCTYLTISNRLFLKLETYTKQQIKDIASSYNLYSKKELDKIKTKTNKINFTKLIEISRYIIEYNMLAIYEDNYEGSIDNYKINVEIPELEHLYDDLLYKDIIKKLFKSVFKRLYYIVLKRALPTIVSSISTNIMLKRIILDKSNDIIFDFSQVIDLFQKMGLSNREMIEYIICLVSCNIYNGIYDKEIENEKNKNIVEAHRLIEQGYLTKMNTDEKIDVASVTRAFTLLNCPNINSISYLLEKMNEKETTQKENKTTNIVERVNVTPVIDKATYYEGIKIISKYYELDKNIVKGILKISEIQYVVSIMQSLKFSSGTIETFISKALKNHRSISALDRYLDLSQKIDYYKEDKDIKELDKTLHDLVKEYINSSIKDKEFWLTSINEELEALESLLNRSYDYELGIIKTQE